MPQYSLRDAKSPKREPIMVRSGIKLVVVLLLCYLASRYVNIPSAAFASTRQHRIYTTNFPHAENPISEGGKWTNGRQDGLDWANVRTAAGRAFGTQSGGVRPAPQKYDDSAALLTGEWGPNQTAEATFYAVNQSDRMNEEVELRLRSAFSAHQGTGYEILFRSSMSAQAYCEIVRWNGPLGSFTYLQQAKGPQCGIATGSVVKATIVGNVITAYINGRQVLQATDNTYTNGNPGIGFYVERATGVNCDFGFTSFTATDQ